MKEFNPQRTKIERNRIVGIAVYIFLLIIMFGSETDYTVLRCISIVFISGLISFLVHAFICANTIRFVIDGDRLLVGKMKWGFWWKYDSMYLSSIKKITVKFRGGKFAHSIEFKKGKPLKVKFEGNVGNFIDDGFKNFVLCEALKGIKIEVFERDEKLDLNSM